MANKVKQAERKTNRLQWFLYVIVIPVVFAVTITLVVATIAGVNLFQVAQEYGSKAPIISTFIDDPEEEQLMEDLASHEATIQDQDTTISNLESQLTSKDQEIDELNDQIQTLENELEQAEEARVSREESTSRLARSFTEMDASRAADIITEMEQALALDILEEMSDERRGEILGAMDSELAANLSSSLMRRSDSE
ncbi:MotE family protein [Alkalibacillus aidingensis]|uniref:MotE family protein n=1 Tax=Alkalibacillus aidingensis TaxID=2747607 RepID=UPI001660FCBB|nr:hypothetical protein [Alkalibacillus aidingensis]